MIKKVRFCCNRCGKFTDFPDTTTAKNSGWFIGREWTTCKRCLEIEKREEEYMEVKYEKPIQ